MSDNYGNVVKLPSQSTVSAEVKPGDILAGYSPPPQVKGVTLADGAGVLDAGTVLGKRTSDDTFDVYADAGTDGLDVAIGVLYETVDTGADGDGNVAGNIILSGVLKHDKLTGLTAAAIADLNGRVVGHLNQFIF